MARFYLLLSNPVSSVTNYVTKYRKFVGLLFCSYALCSGYGAKYRKLRKKPVQHVEKTLIKAVEKNSVTQVRKLINLGRPVNEANEREKTPLHIAAALGYIKPLRELLTVPSCDVNARDKEGHTALYWALQKNHLSCFQTLIQDLRTDLSAKYEGKTVLSLAVLGNKVNFVKKLLSTDRVDVNTPDDNGNTPLHNAVDKAFFDCINLLTNCSSININAQNKKGETALHSAILAGNERISSALLASPDIDFLIRDDEGLTVINRAREGEVSEILALLKGNHKAKEMMASDHDFSGYTALHIASANGDFETCKTLVKNHAFLDSQTKRGETALHFAIKKGHRDIVKLLIGGGADIYLKTPYYLNALDMARHENSDLEELIYYSDHCQSFENPFLQSTGPMPPDNFFDSNSTHLNIQLHSVPPVLYTSLLLVSVLTCFLLKKLYSHLFSQKRAEGIYVSLSLVPVPENELSYDNIQEAVGSDDGATYCSNSNPDKHQVSPTSSDSES